MAIYNQTFQFFNTTDVAEIYREQPKNILIYYGWLSSFNSETNSWNNELVAQDIAQYNIIVLGAGIASPLHEDYVNTNIILTRIKELNPNLIILGYVTVFQTFEEFKNKATEWNKLYVHGIFLDEAGYDYGTVETNGRSAFNEKVNYCHGLSHSCICMANAWNMDHIIGTIDDVSYPNSKYNIQKVESSLTADDWFLLESFAVNTASYALDYEGSKAWFDRGIKAIKHRDIYNINLASIAVIDNKHDKIKELFEFAFTAGLIFSLDAIGTSDILYGAVSSKVIKGKRPNIIGIGDRLNQIINVTLDKYNEETYIRFNDSSKITVTFASCIIL